MITDSPTDSSIEPRASVPLAFRIVRGGAAVALVSYFHLIFGFASNLVLTRLLTPADFGIFALGVFFFALLNLRPKLGIDQSFAHHTATDAQSSGTFAVLSVASGIASLLLTLAVIPVLTLLGYPQSVIFVTLALAGIGVMDSMMGIAWVQMDKALLFTRVSLVTAVAFPISYLPAFYLALNNGGYWALVSQNVLYAVLLLVGLWLMARRELSEIWKLRWTFSKTLAKQFIRFGVVVGLTTILATIVYQFDNFLVGSFSGFEALGYYDRAYRIAQWTSLLVGAILTRTAFYAYTRLQNDLPRLTKTVEMSLWIVTTAAVPIALAIFVSADELVLFLFGAAWLPSAALLKVLVAYSVLRPLLDDASALFVAVGHPRRSILVLIFQAISLVLAATPLTLRLGAVGAAIGVGVAFIVGLLVTYYFVRRTLPQLSLRNAFLAPVVAAAITLGIALLASSPVRGLASAPVLTVAIMTALTLSLYVGITLALRPHSTRERAAYVWRLFRNQHAA